MFGAMLANLLDVDEAMIQTAARNSRGMALFYDFAPAFPSIEHDFFHNFFSNLGWPTWLLNFFRMLYLDNFCKICLRRANFIGVAISRGIRQ